MPGSDQGVGPAAAATPHIRSEPGQGIDIVFATHNGATTLPRMLAALEALRPPGRPWRILAVDNASTDETATILRRWEGRLPLRLLSCVTPGKMPALRSALPLLQGDLIVFTDDDVEPSEDWLQAYERAADDHPDAGVFGGPIVPTPLEPLEGWYEVSRAHHEELFARAEIADGCGGAPNFYGPNFMLRRRHLDVFDAVPARLGPTFEAPKRSAFAMGEDSAIMEIAAARNIAQWGVADASVRHLVRNFQTHLDFMLQRAERHGRGWAIRYMQGGPPLGRRGARLVASGLAAALEFGALSLVPPRSPSAPRFGRLWRLRWRMGAAREVLEDLGRSWRPQPWSRPAAISR